MERLIAWDGILKNDNDTHVIQGGQGIETEALEVKCKEVDPLKCLCTEAKQKPNLEKPSVPELNPLPENLEYTFLGDKKTLMVIIAKSLTCVEKSK